MVDRQFSEPDLAVLYDVFCSWDQRDDFAFYLPYLMAAEAVLDVGCGTGALLHGARAAGHTGRLCGLDPADAMLAHARTRPDIEWIRGDLSSVDWSARGHLQAFDLVVMTGHAFQVLREDDDLRTALTVIRSLLTAGGRFAFETRNPAAREWERWTPENSEAATDRSGNTIRVTHVVELPVDGDLVSFRTTYTSQSWSEPRVSESTLRFLDAEVLRSFLAEAGLTIEVQFGDWDRRPLFDTSPEIITLAKRG